jgi:hypothetical protein
MESFYNGEANMDYKNTPDNLVAASTKCDDDAHG